MTSPTEYDIADQINKGDFEKTLRLVKRFQGNFVECDNPAQQICYGIGQETPSSPGLRFQALAECLKKLDGNEFARNPDSDWNLLSVAHQSGSVDTVRFLLLMGWPMSGLQGKRFAANGRSYIRNVERNGPSRIYSGHAYWRDGGYLRDLKRAQRVIECARRAARKQRGPKLRRRHRRLPTP